MAYEQAQQSYAQQLVLRGVSFCESSSFLRLQFLQRSFPCHDRVFELRYDLENQYQFTNPLLRHMRVGLVLLENKPSLGQSWVPELE